MTINPFIFHALEQTQQRISELIEGLDIDTINAKVPGVNNTIGWNFGHLVVTSQLLTYKLGGQEMTVNLRYLAKFRKGTTGLIECTQEEINDLLTFHKEHLESLQADYAAGKFGSFEKYETSYGTTLESIEDGITFCGFHETLHLGYIMALRRALGK